MSVKLRILNRLFSLQTVISVVSSGCSCPQTPLRCRQSLRDFFIVAILNQKLPFIVSVIRLIVGWWGGRRKSTAEVEIIKLDHVEKLLKLNDQYLIAPLTKKIDLLSQKIQRLERTLSRISDCNQEKDCPVRNELKKQNKCRQEY